MVTIVFPTDLKWFVLINYIFLYSIIGIIAFIFLRRLIMWPFQYWFNKRVEIYSRILNDILFLYHHSHPNFPDKFLQVKNIIDKYTMEKVILDILETPLNAAQQNTVINIYDDLEIAEWRIKQLKSWSAWKRKIAAHMLGKSLSHKAVLPLMLALRDNDRDVRFIAAKALGKLNATSAVEYIVSLLQVARPERYSVFADIIISFGNNAINPIFKTLSNNSNYHTLYWCLKILAKLDLVLNSEQTAFLKNFVEYNLNNVNYKIRGECITLLANIHAVDNIAQIINALHKDHSPFVRMLAAKALGILKDYQSVDALILGLEDDIWDVNLASAQSLSIFGKDILYKLKSKLNHPKNIVKKRCREIIEVIENNYVKQYTHNI